MKKQRSVVWLRQPFRNAQYSGIGILVLVTFVLLFLNNPVQSDQCLGASSPISEQTFHSGDIVDCYMSTGLALGPTVTVEDGAILLLAAPTASINGPLSIQGGAILSINSTVGGPNQAVLGPLAGAGIKAYRLTDQSNPVEIQTALGLIHLAYAGRFHLSLGGIPNDEWVLVSATGGQDIDTTDDGVIDTPGTANKGSIHGLAKAAEWRAGSLRINALSEIAWLKVAGQVQAGNWERLEDQLRWIANQFFSADIDGDGDIDHRDINAFDPENAAHRGKMTFSFDALLTDDEFGHSFIRAIHEGDHTEATNQLGRVFGDRLDPCPNQPGNTPDADGYCTSDSQTITAGEALVLTLDDAVLTIPADVLAAGMAVTLAEMDLDLLDEPPNGTGETLITPVYVLAFSAAQPANGTLTFAFDIPPDITTGFYARIKIEGGLATEGQSDTDWIIVVGEYDVQQSQLTIELGATATRFLVAGISTDAVVADSSPSNGINDSEPVVPRSLATKAVIPDPFPSVEWASYGWVVMCGPIKFSKFNLTSCNRLSPDFHPMMNDLGTKLYASDQTLTSLGFGHGDGELVKISGVERSGVPYVIYDPDNRSITTSSKNGKEISYVMAWIDPDNTDNTLGYYSPSTSRLFVDRFEGDDTIIHELMHAVQYIQIRNAWDPNWIIEALASAIEIFSSAISVPSGEEYRYFGNWRDWSIPLVSEVSLDAYQALEFWLSLNGTMSLIPDFYDNLRGKPKLTKSNSYVFVDEALTETGLPSLRDAYTDLILSRDSDVGYPHCEPVSLVCSGANCEHTTDISPISAHCFDMNVDFEDACSNTKPDIEVTLESDVNPNIKLMVDGVVHEANTPVPFSGQGRIWAMNMNAIPQFSSPTAKLVFSCNWKVVTLIAQYYNSSANSTIHTKNTSPFEIADNKDFKRIISIEDPVLATAFGYPFDLAEYAESNERVIKRHVYTLQGLGVDDIFEETSEDTTTPIAPLGSNSLALNHTATSVIASGFANAQASSNSNMLLDEENGVPILFDWTFSATRSLDYEDISKIGGGVANSGALGQLYINVASGNAAVLEMNWDCSLHGVSVQKQVPSRQTITNWVKDDTGCGVGRRWTLGAGSYSVKFFANSGIHPQNSPGTIASSGLLSLSVKEIE